jgi:hypothetical protein
VVSARVLLSSRGLVVLARLRSPADDAEAPSDRTQPKIATLSNDSHFRGMLLPCKWQSIGPVAW